MTRAAAEWVRDRLEDAGISEEDYRAAVGIYRTASGTRGDRQSRAYEYAHNIRHLRGAELGHFAQAYADTTDDEPMTLAAFWPLWESGSILPDVMGTYHHAGPWRKP